MKKFRQLLAGVVIGAVLASTGVALANGPVNFVNFKFKFNGTEKPVPEGYAVLSYQDRTYVPARFVAENMGGFVDWDQSTQTVIVKNGGLTKAELQQIADNLDIVRYVSYINELDDLMFTIIGIAADPQKGSQTADLTKRIDDSVIQSWQESVGKYTSLTKEDKDALIGIGADLLNSKKQVLAGQRDSAWNSASTSKQVSNNLWNKYDQIVQGNVKAGLAK